MLLSIYSNMKLKSAIPESSLDSGSMPSNFRNISFDRSAFWTKVNDLPMRSDM